ncbi:hypothetical protein IHE44_0015021 [Lamprotornis superbus]|uniref:E3 ubiquitin-protein ligase RNF220 middle domain-containing protein n=1 Tax=Lamprotornis superbus TaxID=245042 RepID=A0A835TW76_9PASS|nr:hypothetical protein IHE44_0015021 [Lamprotornis superbus]
MRWVFAEECSSRVLIPASIHIFCWLYRATRIGKMKRRKQDEGQREGSCMTEDDSVDIENENGNRFEEYEWCGQKRIRATTLLEGGFRVTGKSVTKERV